MSDPHDDPFDGPPIDRPESLRDLHVHSTDDLARLSAELYVFARDHPRLTHEDAEEISTMMYELLTHEWADRLDGGDRYHVE